MDPLSRRHTLRLTGGALATAGLAGGALVGPGGLSGFAAEGPPKVRIRLNHKGKYRPGQRMVLRLNEDLRRGRRIRIVDSSGRKWTRILKNHRRQVWVANAGRAGESGTVRVFALFPDGSKVRDLRYRARAHYTVVGGDGGIDLGSGALIGMSSPAGVWDQRVREVGGGLAARRIFADLGAGASNQMKLVKEAHAAGMMPVISYKVGGDVAGAVAGRHNAVAADAADELASFGLPTAVTFWHEPHGDMTPAEYAAASRQLVPIFQRGELRVGPLLNGWLLDRQQSTFASYAPDDLLDMWDWFGIDTYEAGTIDAPGDAKPAHRIPAMAKFLQSRGHGDKPMGIGEYNGYSGSTIAAAGDALLTTKNIWFGCMWNSTEGKGHTLTGERLAAFQDTLADPRNTGPRLG